MIQPDLILLDVMMPGIDGFETCRRLKADESTKNIPIIFMTALCDVENQVKGLQLGAVDYITKPIQVEEVLARVHVHLALRNAQVQLINEVSDRREAQIQLQQTLKELQQTQTQLIQSEKMSSLGQLVAGVAHEINNPVNFIYGNLTYAQEYIQNLLKLLQVYQQHYPNPVSQVQTQIAASELDFLREDLPKLLNSMKVGAKRIREIVLSLRVFSRLDESQIKAVDIHEGINSTLMILGHRLKVQPNRPEIKIIKEYGNLPLVECYAGQLNQVFMNILSNAIDAIEEGMGNREWGVGESTCRLGGFRHVQRFSSLREAAPTRRYAGVWQSGEPEGERITICCKFVFPRELVAPNAVTICIADNGFGIPESVKKRIFDLFFTTKSVGLGTGMGLAISYEIVTKKTLFFPAWRGYPICDLHSPETKLIRFEI